jgi:hypothetical protein
MPVVFIRHIGANLAFIEPVGAVDPGFGGGWTGEHPGHDLPWGPGHPGNRPPGSFPGRIDNTLPGAPGHPDARPPAQPPQVAPGSTLVLVRDAMGIWHYAELAPGSAPPKPVPVPPTPTPPPGTVSPPIAPTPAPKPA